MVTLKTGANVKDLSFDPRSGRVYAMNRGPGTISVIDPDTDAIIDTLKADRGSLTALNPITNRLYVSASTGTDPSVIDLATKQSTVIHAGTEGNALSVNVKRNKIYFVGYEDNFLTVVDGATNQSSRIELPGFHQWESAFNEANGRLYLPTPNNDAVTVVDTRTSVVSTIGTGNVPMAAAINSVTNRLYVVNYGSSDVTVIDDVVGPADRDGHGRAVAAADRDQRQDQPDLRRQHARQQRVGHRWPDEHRRRDRRRRTRGRGPWPSTPRPT